MLARLPEGGHEHRGGAVRDPRYAVEFCRVGDIASKLLDTRDAAEIAVDGCQYANWSEKIFREMNEGGVSAVHVTVAYHEDFRETVENLAYGLRAYGCAEADVKKVTGENRPSFFERSFGPQT